jgi:hypothetical protein
MSLSGCEPVFNLQAGNPSEVADIARDDNQAMPEGDGGDLDSGSTVKGIF